jgi:UDP-GlcNAc3NAcA epimerase
MTRKILTIVGARPQFIKAAMVSSAITQHNAKSERPLTEEIVHTGQHYDKNMSHIFFEEMGIPQPAANLAVGSGSHGETTAAMLIGIEQQILDRQPDGVLVYGDTNSTLAAALAASKLHVPIFHVEAGLRSFNKRMPEEINRILTDHVSDLLFCPTSTAIRNLDNEGITVGVHHVGDVMQDAALYFGELADHNSRILQELELTPQDYFLATVHRAENTDSRECLANIMKALIELSDRGIPVVLPLHPRTKAMLNKHGLDRMVKNSKIRLLAPVSFLDMVRLERNARGILTDSGGVQKEAYFHKIPCITLRNETEWVETVEAGWNQIVGCCPEKILGAAACLKTGSDIAEYGDGDSGQQIVTKILEFLHS